MKYLLVIDLQREFVKDQQGELIYQKCLKYINDNRIKYDSIIAAAYQNGYNVNMQRYLGYTECMKTPTIEFQPDYSYIHSGYSMPVYPQVTINDQIDIIGFDTDACVLSAAFDVFNLGCGLKILSNLCWSSGGKDCHLHGLAIMSRQFGKALDMETDV